MVLPPPPLNPCLLLSTEHHIHSILAQVLDQNVYYAAPDDMEDNGATVARDNNSLYGHSE